MAPQTSTSEQAPRWLKRRGKVSSSATERIICFPYAGGTANAYSNWSSKFPASVDVVAVQYPGRQDRMSEPCVEDMEELATVIACVLQEVGDLPLTLFGHSMGSAVAYEVAKKLELEFDGRLTVKTVFVSGRPAPSASLNEPKHRLSDAELIEAMRLLDAENVAVYDIPKLWPIILPPLRSDLRLLDNHRPRQLTALAARIVAMGGRSDPTCSIRDLDSWSGASRVPLTIRDFEGGHHYIRGQESKLIAAISSCMT